MIIVEHVGQTWPTTRYDTHITSMWAIYNIYFWFADYHNFIRKQDKITFWLVLRLSSNHQNSGMIITF